jgi:hypothetical protein
LFGCNIKKIAGAEWKKYVSGSSIFEKGKPTFRILFKILQHHAFFEIFLVFGGLFFLFIPVIWSKKYGS